MFLKDPQAIVDYRVDWTAALGGEVSLTASVWEVRPVEPGGVALVESSLEGSLATARVAGGLPGHSYAVGNTVTLSDGSVDERSLLLRVEDR